MSSIASFTQQIPYQVEHEQYIQYPAPNYYPQPQTDTTFSNQYYYNTGVHTGYAAFVGYDTSASSSPESYHSVDTPPSTPPSSDHALNPSIELPRRVSRRGPNHIPRPRNAFMIFRSELCASGKISKKVEGDNRHISITAAAIWKAMPDHEKQNYQAAAEVEKIKHRQLYPDYRFTPTIRTTKPLKRKVNRNSAKDKERSRQVAQFIIAGKIGDELEEAVRNLDEGSDDGIQFIPSPNPISPASHLTSQRHTEVRGWVPHDGLPETVNPQSVLRQSPLPSTQFPPNYAPCLPTGWGNHCDPSCTVGIPRSRSRTPGRVRVELYEDVVAAGKLR
ncbi:specific transcriptional repressor [Favolaschia claudopus]|uniref:Specific transcriptional repressor n=1 Tax=Favolaschia claudopus TaxID=2862362 RepID=A0AAW0EGZ3_9AGAR